MLLSFAYILQKKLFFNTTATPILNQPQKNKEKYKNNIPNFLFHINILKSFIIEIATYQSLKIQGKIKIKKIFPLFYSQTPYSIQCDDILSERHKAKDKSE